MRDRLNTDLNQFFILKNCCRAFYWFVWFWALNSAAFKRMGLFRQSLLVLLQ